MELVDANGSYPYTTSQTSRESHQKERKPLNNKLQTEPKNDMIEQRNSFPSINVSDVSHTENQTVIDMCTQHSPSHRLQESTNTLQTSSNIGNHLSPSMLYSIDYLIKKQPCNCIHSLSFASYYSLLSLFHYSVQLHSIYNEIKYSQTSYITVYISTVFQNNFSD
jgi:hypothetical protein